MVRVENKVRKEKKKQQIGTEQHISNTLAIDHILKFELFLVRAYVSLNRMYNERTKKDQRMNTIIS